MARKSLDVTCPVARTLDIVGARWTLLIIRDLLPGTMRFQDLQERLPRMAPNVLSDRLKILEEHGLVRREFYSDHPPRAAYTLTDPGREARRHRIGARSMGPAAPRREIEPRSAAR
ncbi:helix-turn-helix domain-containing protein (plasmid) [Bradyrhizobium guangxiense]